MDEDGVFLRGYIKGYEDCIRILKRSLKEIKKLDNEFRKYVIKNEDKK